MAGSLGRVKPPDWEHLEKYPLTADTTPTKNVPGVMGIDWFSVFDHPVRDHAGKWWIGVDESFKELPPARVEASGLRGGHAICSKPRGATDPTSWWEFYDQDEQGLVVAIKSPYPWKRGGCTGFSTARLLAQLNRRRYDPYHLYLEAQKIDAWGGEEYEGSSVRAALDVARTTGPRPIVRGSSRPPSAADGIQANRWARDAQDFAAAQGYQGVDFVDLLQSWGRPGYPHIVRLPLGIVEWLRTRDGELGIVTDR